VTERTGVRARPEREIISTADPKASPNLAFAWFVSAVISFKSLLGSSSIAEFERPPYIAPVDNRSSLG
jgi:hypothetical protein